MVSHERPRLSLCSLLLALFWAGILVGGGERSTALWERREYAFYPLPVFSPNHHVGPGHAIHEGPLAGLRTSTLLPDHPAGSGDLGIFGAGNHRLYV